MAFRPASAALLFALAACAPVPLHAAGVRQQQREKVVANPIRKVVTMLQDMQKKVTEEGKKEEELYEKFMCYCKNSGGSLSESIEAAGAKVESLTSALAGTSEKKALTEADLKEHQQSRSDTKEAMAEATALREKETRAYAKEKSEFETNLAALQKAIAAIEKGVAGAFLQSQAANTVRRFAIEKAELPDATREEFLSFLSGAQGEGYAPQSGEITGILQQLKDSMSASLAEATSNEEEAIRNYEALMAAKKQEMATLTGRIEEEMMRVGDLGVELTTAANDLQDTKDSLAEDTKFKQELEEGCATKTKEWEVVKATRAEELVALADTIKVLNDDDALELFKKTIPSASSFVQLTVNAASQKARSLKILRRASKVSGRPELDLIALALQGKTVGFEKVIAMIDEMVANLMKEQAGDDSKKHYCETRFDETDDRKKQIELAISDSETAIDEMTGSIATLKEEINALEAGIKALDKSVAEATEQRRADNADYKELMANDATAKEVLTYAKNRLNKFYNPKLYVAPPKRELTEAERITVSMGGTVATPAPGGIAGTGIGAALVQVRQHSAHKDAPAPPPDTFGPYTKKTQQGSGVIAMIDLLVNDLDKEMQEVKVMETDAQADYVKMMEDAASKRAVDSKAITQKNAAKANTEESLEAGADQKADSTKELMTTLKVIQGLHGECDWLIQYFLARREARTGEIESLGNAKSVLSGADYALLQTGSTANFLGRRG